MSLDTSDRWWWQEYPVRDREYVRWYPPDLRPTSEPALWQEHSNNAPSAFGVYVHIPFCEVICPFCPYHKSAATEETAAQLTQWLVRELDLYRSKTSVATYPIKFIYFGGGTPSILPASSVDTLLSHLSHSFALPGDAEVTMEVNPGFVSRDKLRDFRNAGVNRVSFGVQSFSDDWLKIIGSHHSAQQASDAISWARRAGFENVGIDLLFRLPGQSMTHWEQELVRAVAHNLDHISTYSMVLDPEGGLGHQIALGRVPPQPDEEQDLDMSQMAFAYLGDSGFHHYASCASCGHDFAKPERESRYEVLHWGAPQAQYIGIGPGAYGFVNDHVYCTVHDLPRYQRELAEQQIPVVAAKRMTKQDAMARYFVLGVKCVDVEFQPFVDEFNEDPRVVFSEPLEWIESEGLAQVSETGLKLTRRGVLYMDNVSKAFYSPDTRYCPQPLEPDMEALSRRGELINLGAA